MRLFIHLKDLTLSQNHNFELMKILISDEKTPTHPIIVLSIQNLTTTDELIDLIVQKLQINPEELIMKLVIKHQNQYQGIRVVKGFNLGLYCRVPADKPSILQYQIELEVTTISSIERKVNEKEQKCKQNPLKSESSEKVCQLVNMEIYRHSKQLFLFLKKDELGEFMNLIDLFSIKYTESELSILLNLFDEETGFTLLHESIRFNKYQFLETLIKDYSDYIDFNIKSIDGWLPIQLALSVQNRKSIDFLIEYHEDINLDLNCENQHGQTIFNLIDNASFDLISKIVKTFPIRFEDIHKSNKVNAYEYVWNHHRLTEEQRKKLIALMHEQHIEHYDCFRWDQLLYTTCKKYLPEATKTISPRKQTYENLTLKVISGEIIKCKSTAFFSKYVFLSVNSYIGAIEEYQINNKMKLSNDREKIDKYKKQMHLSFEEIERVYLMEEKQKSWFLKKEWYCFIVQEKRGTKYVFACYHQHTANQWINQIKQAMKAWNKIQVKSFNSGTAKNYYHISDVEYKASDVGIESSKGKLSAHKLIQFFSTRLSLCESETRTLDSSIGKDLQSMKSKSTYNKASGPLTGTSEPLLGSSTSLKYKDFNFIQLLGEGSFGQVFLVECLKNKKHYALKVFQKKKIILSKQTKFVIAEVNILKQIKHPFINCLYFTFQTPNFIYLGLQYCPGKDLSKHLNQEMTFDEADVRLYAAEILLALEYLHSMGIIYRDLKPENIMLGRDGHIMLVDFGLSKKTQNNFAKTFCGSPAYLSPEMLDRHGVGPESDYFTLGVVLYQFLFGEPPFYADNIHMLYQNIQNGRIKFPRKIPDVTIDFLTKLLQKDPKQRLGAGSIQDIKTHEYFAGMDWQDLYNKKIPAPHRDLMDDITEEYQDQKELINIFHDDFDYSQENQKINRFKNFSFAREEVFQ